MSVPPTFPTAGRCSGRSPAVRARPAAAPGPGGVRLAVLRRVGFTFGDAQDTNGKVGETQTYLYPLDDTPAMDFRLP